MQTFFLIIWPTHLRCIILLVAIGTLIPQTAAAWGTEGHYQVGRLALEALDETAASQIHALLGSNEREPIAEACNWPDQVRETREWEWSAPQHYVNIPRAAREYERERDCPDGMCVTEAIKKYAGQLADPRLDKDGRWQAFAWLCHLVGDLHQPLHTGYKDDRGGNYVEIIYQGEEANLHQFWDRVLIQERLETTNGWQIPAGLSMPDTGGTWRLSETDEWTTESHALVESTAYPPTVNIQADFADQSWVVIQDQWLKAGSRLAQILNASIGEGEVLIIRNVTPDCNHGE